MKYLLPFVVLPVLLTNGCKKVDSSDLKDDVPYYQSYSVSYDKTYGTSAMASFKLRDANGVRVDLANGAGVAANSIGPTTDFLDKTLYRWNFTGTPDVNFILTKNSGTKINNGVSLTDIGNTDFATGFPTTASKSSGLTFNWTGSPVATDETLNITISRPDSGSSAMKTFTATNSSYTVNFTTADMVNVKPGQLTVELSRSRELPLDNKDGTSSGAISVRMMTRKMMTLNP